MNVTLRFDLFGYRLGGITLRVVNWDKSPTAPSTAGERTVKWFSKKWTDKLFA